MKNALAIGLDAYQGLDITIPMSDSERAADLKARLRQALAVVCTIQDEARKHGISLVGNVAYVEATGRCEVVHLSASKQL